MGQLETTKFMLNHNLNMEIYIELSLAEEDTQMWLLLLNYMDPKDAFKKAINVGGNGSKEMMRHLITQSSGNILDKELIDKLMQFGYGDTIISWIYRNYPAILEPLLHNTIS